MNKRKLQPSKIFDGQNTDPRRGHVSREVLEAWLKVRTMDEGDCWLWRGAKCRLGLPRSNVNGSSSATVKRYVWQCCHPGAMFGHSRRYVASSTCGEASCVNPDHIQMARKRDVQAGKPTSPTVLAKRTAAMRKRGIGSQIAEQVKADRAEGATYAQLATKYDVAIGTIGRIFKPECAHANGASVFTWRPA